MKRKVGVAEAWAIIQAGGKVGVNPSDRDPWYCEDGVVWCGPDRSYNQTEAAWAHDHAANAVFYVMEEPPALPTEHDLTTDTGRIRALLALEGTGQLVRRTLLDGRYWDIKADRGAFWSRRRDYSVWRRTFNPAGLGDNGDTWSIVSEQLPVAEMTADQLWAELGFGPDAAGSDYMVALRTLVSQKRDDAAK